MSVYIKGMEMPKNGHITITISDDGEVVCNSEVIDGKYQYRSYGRVGKAIPVPPLGRLIDADALTKMCREMQSIDWNKKASPYSWEHAYEEFENDIDEAPTIIPADPPREETFRARWIDMGDHLLCSACGAAHYGADKNFCPNCGADMREPPKEET